jgi:hypothetical protein
MARPNFFNDNVNRCFPFKERSVGVATPSSGAFTLLQLPDLFVADCGFIMGPESGFFAESNTVYLYRVSRPSLDTFEFEFRSDASPVNGSPLIFTRSLSDETYTTEFLESDIPVDTSVSDSISYSGECGEPYWSGYLVTGDMSRIAERLSVGDEVIRVSENEAIVEPALIQNLNESQLVAVGVANADRSRAIRPESCLPWEYGFETGIIYVDSDCLQGEIQLKAGYNLKITDSSTGFTFSPLVNAGEGEPCEQVPLFAGETGPTNGNLNLLGGGYLCNEVFRTVNGISGPYLSFFAGQGVSITGNQTLNSLTVNIDLSSLLLCPEVSYSSQPV